MNLLTRIGNALREIGRARRQLAALDYAVLIIESYQMDIRNTSPRPRVINSGEETATFVVLDYGDSPWPSLADHGFCQGRIYTGALDRIRQIADGGE